MFQHDRGEEEEPSHMSRMRDILRKADTPGWPGSSSQGPLHPAPRVAPSVPDDESANAATDSLPRPKPPASTFGTPVRWSATVAPRVAGAKPSERILPSFPAAIRIDPSESP